MRQLSRLRVKTRTNQQNITKQTPKFKKERIASQKEKSERKEQELIKRLSLKKGVWGFFFEVIDR